MPKKIEAIVRLERMQHVKDSLVDAGVGGMTISQATGWGKERAIQHLGRAGKSVEVDLLPKAKFEIIIDDSKVDQIVKTIIQAAKTGAVGDGIVIISDVNNCINIRTETELEL
ncbi:MAG: nitrogen regulatory protein P-II [Candidatus Nitrosocaldaceae archaeon]|nr:MAG: nitrogen regulatory protein P-II [Candidatus Nitrosocaldaceae archaeon]